jgi:hypothetical protein
MEVETRRSEDFSNSLARSNFDGFETKVDL